MSREIKDPQLKQVLDKLAKFGFGFFGYNEEGMPLVKAENEQVIPINSAIEYANEQIKLQSQESSSSPEEFPQQPSSPETSVETSLEASVESTVETKDASTVETRQEESKELQVKKQSPTIKLAPKDNKPYNKNSFDVESFDPTSTKAARAFISKNQDKSSKQTEKWLSVLFRKFLDEIEEGK